MGILTEIPSVALPKIMLVLIVLADCMSLILDRKDLESAILALDRDRCVILFNPPTKEFVIKTTELL